MAMVFTENEVRKIIGDKVDIGRKFEEAHQHEGDWCLGIEIDFEDSEEYIAELMAYHSNFVAAVERNSLIDEQLCRMRKISGVTK